MRSKLWDAATWPARDDLPSAAEVSHAHARDPELTVEDFDRYLQESLRHRLD